MEHVRAAAAVSPSRSAVASDPTATTEDLASGQPGAGAQHGADKNSIRTSIADHGRILTEQVIGEWERRKSIQKDFSTHDDIGDIGSPEDKCINSINDHGYSTPRVSISLAPNIFSTAKSQSSLFSNSELRRLSTMQSQCLDHGRPETIDEISVAEQAVPSIEETVLVQSSKDRLLSDLRNDCCSCLPVLRPDSHARVYWDLLAVVALVYIALVTPVRIGFEVESKAGSFDFIFEQCLDLFFLMDIVLNFRTGYLSKDGGVVLRPTKIARNYVQTYFLIDLVSSVPIDLFISSAEHLESAKVLKAGKILKVGRILKLTKLARLMKLPHLVERFEDDIQMSVIRLKLSRLLFATALFSHLNACGWALVSHLTDSFYYDSWMRKNEMIDESVLSQYIAAIYWSIMTMTTVGYGDISPQTDSERVYSIATMVFGGCFYAYVIATLSSIVTNQDANQRLVSERMDSIQSFMRIRRFPKQLMRRVRKYYRHYYEMKSALHESAILEDLSPALRSEVVLFLVDRSVMQNPLFQQMSPKSFARLLRILYPLKLEKDEFLFHEGDIGEEMFMIISGRVQVIDANGEVHAVLTSGAHFGELCALGVANRRTCGIRASEDCELYALSKSDFFDAFALTEPRTIETMISFAISAYEDLVVDEEPKSVSPSSSPTPLKRLHSQLSYKSRINSQGLRMTRENSYFTDKSRSRTSSNSSNTYINNSMKVNAGVMQTNPGSITSQRFDLNGNNLKSFGQSMPDASKCSAISGEEINETHNSIALTSLENRMERLEAMMMRLESTCQDIYNASIPEALRRQSVRRSSGRFGGRDMQESPYLSRVVFARSRKGDDDISFAAVQETPTFQQFIRQRTRRNLGARRRRTTLMRRHEAQVRPLTSGTSLGTRIFPSVITKQTSFLGASPAGSP